MEDLQKTVMELFRIEAACEALGFDYNDLSEVRITVDGVHILGKAGFEAHIPIEGRHLAKEKPSEIKIDVPKIPTVFPTWPSHTITS